MEEIIEQIEFLSSAPVDIIEKCRIKFIKTLEEFSLEEMSFYERVKILVKLIHICHSKEADKLIVEPILVKWSSESLWEYLAVPRFDADGILGDLSATTLCNIKDLQYLLNLYQDCTPMTILDSHVRNYSYLGMSFNLVCSRLFNAYGITNIENYEWEQVIKAIEDTVVIKTENQLNVIMEFIKEKMEETNRSQIATKPVWVTSKEGETLESYKDCKFEENKILDAILPSLEIQEGDSETVEEIKRLCYSIKDNISTNDTPSLQRLYGPYNQIPDFNCISNLERPCQMLTCVCREFDDEDYDDEALNVSKNVWFCGYCLTCNKSIQKNTYAVRFPIDGGGWQGCFCSFECAKKTDTRIVSESDKNRIDDFEEILTSVGIFDS